MILHHHHVMAYISWNINADIPLHLLHRSNQRLNQAACLLKGTPDRGGKPWDATGDVEVNGLLTGAKRRE